MAKQVAECGELTPVAAVLPALWLWTAVDDPNVVT